MYGRGSYFKKSQLTPEQEMYTRITLYVPNSLFREVKEIATALNMPVSKLFLFGADNELDQPEPFNYPIDWPQGGYQEDKYIEQAAKVLKVIEQVPGGLSKDALLLLRRDIGLSRIEVLHGLRELLEKNIVQEYKNTKAKFNYAGEYYHYRLMPPKMQKERRYRRET